MKKFGYNIIISGHALVCNPKLGFNLKSGTNLNLIVVRYSILSILLLETSYLIAKAMLLHKRAYVVQMRFIVY